jgi:hypothetical protein
MATAQLASSDARARMEADVRFLASDRLEGRDTGSRGLDSAAVYIATRFYGLDLETVVRTVACQTAPQSAECRTSYQQRFAVELPAAYGGGGRTVATQNVLALIPGTDSLRRGRVIVLGAHYDHLGRRGAGRGSRTGPIHNGADDNASGTALMLELAMRIAYRPLPCSVLVAAFTAEEFGLLGSAFLFQQPPIPIDSVDAMLNFDMVGRLSSGGLQVYGARTAAVLAGALTAAADTQAMQVRQPRTDDFRSDHALFARYGIPYLHFFTGKHGQYHTPFDDTDLIDFDGMVRIADLAESILRTMGTQSDALTRQRSKQVR